MLLHEGRAALDAATATTAARPALSLTDARPVVTHIAWPAHSRSPALAGLVRTAVRL
ncbi:hypothetical protein [Streptosporangium sp. NPDC023615]|uniref:hypothetical protein n=1 Tax=Streptosporangium sp. NPDC023615 TaxID=3154794 RepID=UPI003427A32F